MQAEPERRSWIRAFAARHRRSLARSTLVSVGVTGLEYVILAVIHYALSVEAWVSYVLVQFIANAMSFLLYKYWAFPGGSGSFPAQYARQLVIFAGSLALNTGVASLLAYRGHIEPVSAFAIANVGVYLIWNYPGNRYFVFRRRRSA